jgi:hypothetical protein
MLVDKYYTIMTTINTCDKICKNIGRLPLELRHAIFNCLTVDFRLEMVQKKTARIIRTIHEAYDERILDINALKKAVEFGIRWHFFVNRQDELGRLHLVNQVIPKKHLPNIVFNQMGITISTEHPAFNALRKIVIIPNIYGKIDSQSTNRWTQRHARESLNKITTTITRCVDILPTFSVPNSRKFNYYVKKRIFQFICVLTKFISKFEVQVENAAIEKSKQRHKQTFKRTIGKYIPGAFRKMQCKIRLSAKIAKAADITARKEARLVAKTEAKEAKETKAATKKAEKEKAKEAKETKAATKKAEKEAKMAEIIPIS